MKGWIFNIKRYALHDGPGIRTTVFFQGCPLHCPWCHNPESRAFPDSDIPVQGAEQISIPVLMTRLEKDRLFYDQSGGGITISGGEPLAQPEFLSALLLACREKDLHTTVDTCGHGEPSLTLPILRSADLVLFDLKLLDSGRHRDVVGVDTCFIQANLEGLLHSGHPVRLRFPLIPGYTDSRENLDALRRMVDLHAEKIEAISVLPFHPAAAHKYHQLGIRNPMEGQSRAMDETVADIVEQLQAVHPKVRTGG